MKFSSHKHESLLVKATGFIVFYYGYIAYMYVVCTAFFKLTWHLNSCHFYQYPVYFSFTIFYMLFILIFFFWASDNQNVEDMDGYVGFLASLRCSYYKFVKEFSKQCKQIV
jgi:hypothetical protein